ncbi:MAG: hypothetical protein ACREQ9_04435, partial [Candidatus Binatia bacterium]
WEAIQKSKRDYWADRLETEGVAPLLAAAESLCDLVRAVHPDWPSAEDREADYENHVRVKRLLDRAGDAVSRDDEMMIGCF